MERIAEKTRTRARRLFIEGHDVPALATIEALAGQGELTPEMLLIRAIALAETGRKQEAHALFQRTKVAVARAIDRSPDLARVHRKRIIVALGAARRWLLTAAGRPRGPAERKSLTIQIVHADLGFDLLSDAIVGSLS